MAISIPIISTFSAKGIKQAKAEFAKLETVGQKVGFVLGKAAIGATAAFAGLAAGAVALGGFLFQAAKAADADRKSQIDLAKTAERFAKANKAQVAGLEATVEQLMLATGIADDDLRPSLGRLIRSFKNTDKAARAMRIALDISGRTGKDLESVVEAMGKAADGSNTALLRLGTGLSKADLKGKSLEEVMALLETRFKGGAADAANTFEGRMARLQARFGEIVERIGYAVLPYFEKFADILIEVADAFGKRGIAGAWEELKRQFALAGFEQSPVGKFFRSMYTVIQFIYNMMLKLYDLFLAMTGLKIVNWVFDLFDKGFLPEFDKLPDWEDFMKSQTTPSQRTPSRGRYGYTGPQLRFNPYRSQTADAMRLRPTQTAPRAGNVIVNVNGGDPRQVVNTIRRYTYQNGAAPITVR